MRATRMSFEKRYKDGSGVQYAVRFYVDKEKGVHVEVEHIDTTRFPIEELDWLIECLERIRNEVRG